MTCKSGRNNNISNFILGSLIALFQQAQIVGGHAVELNGDFNFQVVLLTLSGFLHCGGVIVNSKFAVTAAHCVKEKEVSQVSNLWLFIIPS